MKKHSSLISTLSLSFLLGCFSPAVPLAGNEILFPSAHAAEGTKWHPGHYFKFGSFKPDEVDTRMDWLGSNPHIIGLSFGFGWTDIESTKDNYNWSLIDEMLAKAEQYDKQLIVRFNEGSRISALGAVPLYVLNDPIYEGGVAPLYADSAKTIEKGWQTKIWVPAVRERMKALMKAFGDRYDDNPRIEAFFLPETSRSRVGGVTAQDLTDAMAEIQGARLNLMPKTIMARNMNWLGGGTTTEYLESIAEEIARVGGGIGHPDTAQHYLYNSTDGLGTPGYKVERMYKDQVAIMPSANTSDLKAEDTAEWIYDYLVNTQEAHYILWNVTWSYTNKKGVFKHSRDWVEEILQVLNANNGYIRTECPPSLAPCITDGSTPTTSACHQLTATSNTSLPPGYAAPWDFFTQAKQTFFKTYCDTTNRLLTLEVGTGTQFEYTYNKGYFLKNNQWQPYTLQCSGSDTIGDWCKGSATATLDYNPSTPDYLLAYHCRLLNNQWKCGCQDQACAKPAWNLQVAK